MAATLAAMLTACDDGSSTRVYNPPSAHEAKISGNILGPSGPVLQSRVEVNDSQGFVVTSATPSGTNHFNLTIPPGTSYPVVIIAHPGASYPSHEPLKAVVTSPMAHTQDITTLTTLVVDNAVNLGGLTSENIAKASAGAIGQQRQPMDGAGAAGGSDADPGPSGGGAGSGGHGGYHPGGNTMEPEEND